MVYWPYTTLRVATASATGWSGSAELALAADAEPRLGEGKNEAVPKVPKAPGAPALTAGCIDNSAIMADITMKTTITANIVL
jgi:hypothetical protein